MEAKLHRSTNTQKVRPSFQRAGACFLVCALGSFWNPFPAFPQTGPPRASQSVSAEHDGQHDFDFTLGSWRTHISRLVHPLTGSTTWVQLEGTKVVQKAWDGAALEEVDADGPAGHFQGLTLFLYNPNSHQWSLNFSNSGDGTFGQPAIGEFKNGRGEFYDQEEFKGRAIFVRIVWSDITPSSHRFEQSFSDDGGKTWEPNFVAKLTRETATATRTAPEPVGSEPGQHDFDWDIGTWKTHQRRLLRPLTGSTAWVEYNGIDVVRKIWGGRGNVGLIEADGSAGHLEIFTLRLYNPQTHQWGISFTNSATGTLSVAAVGELKNGHGEFYDQETYGGKPILLRFSVSENTPTSCSFEQAFSPDWGKTWEANFIVTETRVKDASDDAQ